MKEVRIKWKMVLDDNAGEVDINYEESGDFLD